MEINKTDVETLYGLPGFQAVIDEYASYSNPLLPKPKPDKPTYLALEKMGFLAVYSAVQHGTVGGFMCVVNTKIPHYGAWVATVESIFVMGAQRYTGAGVRLLHVAKALGREWKSPALLITCPWGSDFIKVVERQGGKPHASAYIIPL